MCQACMSRVCGKDEGVIGRLEGEYYVRNSPWLRVLYEVNGYYDF